MNAEERWKKGIPHHPESEKIARFLADNDEYDYFDWKFGGDGDNGEELMYQLDVYFEKEGK